jgi:3-isopropylmalate/(R)-2-methylmalate dehydratase large subunit
VPDGVTAKDIILAIIGDDRTGGGIGHVIEYRGSAIRALSMEGRMTGLQHEHRGGAEGRADRARTTPTFEYLRGSAARAAGRRVGRGVEDWRTLATDEGAGVRQGGHRSTHRRSGRTSRGAPNPGPGRDDRRDGARTPDVVRRPDDARDRSRARSSTWASRAGTAHPRHRGRHGVHRELHEQRIEDLRAAAEVMRGRQVTVPRVMVVPAATR